MGATLYFFDIACMLASCKLHTVSSVNTVSPVSTGNKAMAVESRMGARHALLYLATVQETLFFFRFDGYTIASMSESVMSETLHLQNVLGTLVL